VCTRLVGGALQGLFSTHARARMHTWVSVILCPKRVSHPSTTLHLPQRALCTLRPCPAPASAHPRSRACTHMPAPACTYPLRGGAGQCSVNTQACARNKKTRGRTAQTGRSARALRAVISRVEGESEDAEVCVMQDAQKRRACRASVSRAHTHIHTHTRTHTRALPASARGHSHSCTHRAVADSCSSLLRSAKLRASTSRTPATYRLPSLVSRMASGCAQPHARTQAYMHACTLMQNICTAAICACEPDCMQALRKVAGTGEQGVEGASGHPSDDRTSWGRRSTFRLRQGRGHACTRVCVHACVRVHWCRQASTPCRGASHTAGCQ